MAFTDGALKWTELIEDSMTCINYFLLVMYLKDILRALLRALQTPLFL